MAGDSSGFGLSVALATPFRADGSIDRELLVNHALWCLEQNCRSLTLFGTTGEGPSLSASEKTAVLSDLRNAGISGDQLVIAVITNAAGDAITQIDQAYAAGVRNILLAPPSYFKPVSDDGIFGWYKTTIDGLGSKARDIILYNIPALTGAALSLELISRLRSTFGAAISGIKDSSCNWAYTEPLVRAHAGIDILVGDERDLAAAVRLGGAGSICGVANIFPEAVAGLVKGNEDPFVSAIVNLIDGHSVVPAIKTILAAETGNDGWKRVRAPLDALDHAAEQTIIAGLRQLKLNRAA